MYLARFESSGTTYVEVGIRINLFHINDTSLLKKWIKKYNEFLSTLVSIDYYLITFQISLQKKNSANIDIFILVDGYNEKFIRRICAGFSFLEEIIPNSIEFPSSRSLFDTWKNSLPKYCYHVESIPQNVEKLFVTTGFAVRDVLDLLLSKATNIDLGIAYKAIIQPFLVKPEHLKKIKKNFARIEDLKHVPQTLIEHQKMICENFEHATAIFDEFICVSSDEELNWSISEIQRYFELKLSSLGFSPPNFNLVSEQELEETIYFDQRNDHDISFTRRVYDSFLNSESKLTFINWIPNNQSKFHLPELVSRIDDANLVRENCKNLTVSVDTHVVDDNFVFISYQRDDIEFAVEIINRIKEWGISAWYDQFIPAGTEWDTIIEQKLEKSSLLILILTPNAVKSKFVRREVKFADALGKPILAILSQETKLNYGLSMLFNQYQIIDGRKKEFPPKLKQAISRYIG